MTRERAKGASCGEERDDTASLRESAWRGGIMGCAEDFVDKRQEVSELQVVKSLGLGFANIGFEVRGIGAGE